MDSADAVSEIQSEKPFDHSQTMRYSPSRRQQNFEGRLRVRSLRLAEYDHTCMHSLLTIRRFSTFGKSVLGSYCTFRKRHKNPIFTARQVEE
jgi:hypothetical protein